MQMLFDVRSGILGIFSGWRSHPLDVRPGRRNSLTIPYDDSLKYLTGVVVDSAGQPVPGAMLTVGPAFGFEMLTDSKGRFSIPCFMFKRQCLLYSENDFVLLTGPDTWNQQDYILVRCDHRNLAAIAEFDIEKESDLKIVMSDGVTITGDVAVSDGRPLNGGTVCCYTVINGLSYGLPGEKVTFDGDRYKIGPFPAGLACQFEVTAPGCGNTRLRVEVPKEAGREVVPEKITLPARNMSVSGTVQTESGSSFDIATVYARQEGQGQPIMVMTGDRFTIEGLVAGKVVLSVCASSRYVAFEKCEVEVQAGDTDVKMVLHTKLNIEDDDGD